MLRVNQFTQCLNSHSALLEKSVRLAWVSTPIYTVVLNVTDHDKQPLLTVPSLT